MTHEEFMNSIKDIIGDRNDDIALGVLEYIQNDVSRETQTQIETLTNRVAELETQNTELDTTWRNKYKAAFFEKPNPDNLTTPPDRQLENQPKGFDSLFIDVKE